MRGGGGGMTTPSVAPPARAVCSLRESSTNSSGCIWERTLKSARRRARAALPLWGGGVGSSIAPRAAAAQQSTQSSVGAGAVATR